MNLLPQSVKSQIRREYLLRFSALASLFFTFALVASMILSISQVIPVVSDYVLARRESLDADKYELNETDKKVLAEFQKFRDTLVVLDPRKYSGVPLLSSLIKIAVQEKPVTVKLNGFLLLPEASGNKFQISGVAANRDSLVVFSRRLLSNKIFTDVDLPISNLSKKENIEFSIVATVTKVTQELSESSEATSVEP